MEIQTYEIEESMEGTKSEVEAEAAKMIDELGLEGQKSLVAPKPDGTPARIQYPQMTKAEEGVYDTLFPTKTDVAEYEAGIFPVRILQVIAHGREQFEKLTVWHRAVPDPDPVLVGYVGSKMFVLARWGEALLSFTELVAEARKILRPRYERKLRAKIAECESQLAGVDGLVEQKLAGEYVYIG